MRSTVPLDFSRTFFPCSFGCCGWRPGSLVLVRALPHPRVPWHGGTGKCSSCLMPVVSCSDLQAPIRVVPVPHLSWHGGTGKCSPCFMQVISCSDLQAPIRIVPAPHLPPFPLAVVSPWRLDFGSVQVHGGLPIHGFLHSWSSPSEVLRYPPPLYLVHFSPARSGHAHPRVGE